MYAHLTISRNSDISADRLIAIDALTRVLGAVAVLMAFGSKSSINQPKTHQ